MGSRSMPDQKPGKSKQDYGTPPELLLAVKKRLNIQEFSWDLAADEKNTVAPPVDYGGSGVYKSYYDMEDNSLIQDWHKHKGWMWLNPPFANIEPWVAKAVSESGKGAHIVMLVPSSVGSNWWREYVSAFAYITHLNGRLTFIGEKTPYPKDCSLLLYTPWGMMGTETWNWRIG